MKPRTALALGLASLIAAQVLASRGIAPLRASTVSAGETFKAIKPGEFAGTLLLGGFRGLACDLLWMRASSAKENRRFYESVALFQLISRIQPRFEQIWEYMAWDMAYNIAVEVESQDAKWAWYQAGVDANVRGVLRNPGSERLLRHLAWLLHHKGDDYHRRIESVSWGPLINPVFAQVDARIAPEERIGPLPDGPGITNFALSERLYRAALALAAAEKIHSAAYVRRMVPLAIEKDGNLFRNRGEHSAALLRYLDALETWQRIQAWIASPSDNEQDAYDKDLGRETSERNEGRLRRKAAYLARMLAPEGSSELAATAIDERRFADVRALIAVGDWKRSATRGQITWLDE